MLISRIYKSYLMLTLFVWSAYEELCETYVETYVETYCLWALRAFCGLVGYLRPTAVPVVIPGNLGIAQGLDFTYTQVLTLSVVCIDIYGDVTPT